MYFESEDEKVHIPVCAYFVYSLKKIYLQLWIQSD